jgi:hypothetical protein
MGVEPMSNACSKCAMCGEDWCRVKNLEGNELKYGSKDTNEGFYLKVIALFQEF